jgi:hypothetical protein
VHYDPKSPLSYALQITEWPPAYSHQHLPRFTGNSDPRQFIMSYEAAVAAAGGDHNTMAKSFVIVARGLAQAWYCALPPNTIRTWVELRSALRTNFKGVDSEMVNCTELLNVVQRSNEPLQEWWRRFLQTKARTEGLTDQSVIMAAVSCMRPGPCHSKIERRQPKTLAELHEILKKYCRADNSHKAKVDALRPPHQQQQAQRPPRFDNAPCADFARVGAIAASPPADPRPPPPTAKHNSRDQRAGGDSRNRPPQRQPYYHFCGPDKGHFTK